MNRRDADPNRVGVIYHPGVLFPKDTGPTGPESDQEPAPIPAPESQPDPK